MQMKAALSNNLPIEVGVRTEVMRTVDDVVDTTPPLDVSARE